MYIPSASPHTLLHPMTVLSPAPPVPTVVLQLNVTVKSTADRGYCKADATASNTCSSRIQPAALLAGFPPSAVFATRDVKAGNALAVMPLKNTIRVASGAEGLAVRAGNHILQLHRRQDTSAPAICFSFSVAYAAAGYLKFGMFQRCILLAFLTSTSTSTANNATSLGDVCISA